MPQPTSQPANLRPDLGAVIEFDMVRQRNAAIAYSVFPILEVALRGSTFARLERKHLGKRADVKRGPRGNYNRIFQQFAEDSYATREYGIEAPVDDNELAMYRNLFDIEAVAANRSLQAVLVEAEIRVASQAFSTDNFNATAVDAIWSAENSTPIDDVLAARERIRAATGKYPNGMVIAEPMIAVLQRNPQIIESIASSGAGNATKTRDITLGMLQACFLVDKILVGSMTYDSADEGQDATFVDVWDQNYCLIGNIAETNDIQEPCIGRTFHWADDGSEPGGMVEEYYSNETRSNVVRVRHQVQEKKIFGAAGELLTNIKTAP
jgi:hypothetical protein